MSLDPAALNEALAGRYVVERELGEGGMATVYLADDLRHDRKVAIKVLKPELAAVVGAERFLAEIRTTANLQHPHILPLFDSGEANGLLYYVMPYVAGESLRTRLDREKQLPVDEAVGIATRVAAALQAAHRRGVVHRDIKPANILLHDGEPLVADFGIALAVQEAGGGRLTRTGLSLGTPHYMSPEQATADRDIDARSDIFSLGCVAYEMLAGEPPFTGSTAQAVLARILADPARPLTEVRGAVPSHVAAATERALEKLPADRFSTAEAFAGALEDESYAHRPGVGRTGRRTRPWLADARSRIALGIIVVLALLATIAGQAMLRPEPLRPIGRFAVPLSQDFDFATIPGPALALSPDGLQIVFAGTSSGVTQLWRRPLDELVPTPIPGTDGARTPVYSPDGTAVGFVSAGRLRIVSLTGAPPRTLLEEGLANGPSGLAWSEDGWLYFRPADEEAIGRISAGGNGPLEIVTTAAGLHLYPETIPGGRGLLYTRAGAGGTSEIALLDLESLEERRLFEGGTARYATSGHIVYTSGDGTLLAVPFDADRLEVTGPARTLLGGVRTNASAGSQFALSRTGTLLYLEGSANEGFALAEVDLQGTPRLLQLAPRDYTALGPSWSPDGESLTFSSAEQIYTYDVSRGATPRQITFEGRNHSPVFSPDGRRIAFSSEREGTRDHDLFVKDLGENAPPRSLLTMDGSQIPTQWPTDTILVFESLDEQGRGDLWSLDLSDSESPQPRSYLTSEADLGHMVVSPDGRLAAYSSDESGADEIYVRSYPDPGERTIVSRSGGAIPFWAPDGATLYYGRSVGRQIFAARLRRDPVPIVLSDEVLFGDPGMAAIPFPGAALHPDGDRFIFAVYADMDRPDGGTSAPGRLILVQNFFEELNDPVPNR